LYKQGVGNLARPEQQPHLFKASKERVKAKRCMLKMMTWLFPLDEIQLGLEYKIAFRTRAEGLFISSTTHITSVRTKAVNILELNTVKKD
jgi:hypothetical protein